MSDKSKLGAVGWLAVVLVLFWTAAAIWTAYGCGGVRAMRAPTDPIATLGEMLDVQRQCEAAAEICAGCRDEEPSVNVSPCLSLCMSATAECVKASEGLAELIGNGDAGAGGK